MYALLLLLLTVAPVENAPVLDTLVEIDPIVVLGQRTPQRLSKIVNSAISVPADKMRQSSTENIIEHLTTGNASITSSAVAGVGYGLGTKGQGKLLIRGLGFAPNRGTLVMIDGRPDIAGLFGHPLPDTYRRAGLYSAELIKGAASTLYGSNAVAGVLDLTSFYRPDLDRYTHAELSGGRFDTYNGLVQHSQRFGGTTVAGWYEYIESDNQRPNSKYFNRSGGFRVQRDNFSGFDMFVSGKYSSFDFADPGPVYQPQRTTGDIQRMGMTVGLDRQTRPLQLSARLYSSYGEHAFSDGFNSVDRNNGLHIYARSRTDISESVMFLSGAFSANYLGGSAHNGTPFIRGGDFHEYEYAGHLQMEARYRDWLSLTAGSRYINHELYDDHWVYQFGAVVSPGEYGSLKLSVATAYRNPTINESQLFIISNDSSLKPEEGNFYEVGYFNRIGSHLSIETAVFWRDGENLIATVANPSPPPAAVFANTGSYSHSGWEATVRYSANRLSLAPSFIHLNQDTYNSSVPEERFALTADWENDRLRLAVDASAARRTHSDSLGVPVVIDDYFVVNTSASLRLTNMLSLKGRIENLFDTDYELVHGYPMPGITFRIGLAATL